MSHKTIQLIIGRLLTDEEYRLRFLRDPAGFLGRLREQGVDVTASEVVALLRTDVEVWSKTAKRIDSHLQRCSLHDD